MTKRYIIGKRLRIDVYDSGNEVYIDDVLYKGVKLIYGFTFDNINCGKIKVREYHEKNGIEHLEYTAEGQITLNEDEINIAFFTR